MNYRLGSFGFFSHAALTAESPNRASGNQGLLDQIAALPGVSRITEVDGVGARGLSVSRDPDRERCCVVVAFREPITSPDTPGTGSGLG